MTYQLATFERGDIGSLKVSPDDLISGLEKLGKTHSISSHFASLNFNVASAAKSKRFREPVYFEKLCHKFLTGSLEPEMLRDFCKYNLDFVLFSPEAM